MTARTAREPRHRRTPDVVEWSWRVRDDELDMRLDDLKAKYQWEFADRLFEAGVAPMGEPQWSIRVRPRLSRGEIISDVVARVEVEPWADRAPRGRHRAQLELCKPGPPPGGIPDLTDDEIDAFLRATGRETR